jgi:hypothetical protein
MNFRIQTKFELNRMEITKWNCCSGLSPQGTWPSREDWAQLTQDFRPMRAETGDFDPHLVHGGSSVISAGRRRAIEKGGTGELAQEKGNPIWGF